MTEPTPSTEPRDALAAALRDRSNWRDNGKSYEAFHEWVDADAIIADLAEHGVVLRRTDDSDLRDKAWTQVKTDLRP